MVTKQHSQGCDALFKIHQGALPWSSASQNTIVFRHPTGSKSELFHCQSIQSTSAFQNGALGLPFFESEYSLLTTLKLISRYRSIHLGLSLNLQSKQTANTIGLNLSESISCRFLINMYTFSSRKVIKKKKNIFLSREQNNLRGKRGKNNKINFPLTTTSKIQMISRQQKSILNLV